MACTLCDVREQEQYRTIYDDGLLWVVFNNKPVHEMHVMILPVRHVENWKDLTTEESVAMLTLLDRCMEFFEQQTGQGVNCVINSWKFRSQEHLHAHIIPNDDGVGRYSDDFLQSGERRLADQSAQEKLSNRLRELFKI